MHGDILISFVVVVLRVGDNVNCMHWVCKMLHKTSWQNFFAITSVIRIGSLIFLSQAVSSCSCYAVLYMSDEHLTLCRTRCKTWPRWKAPGFTLTIFCNQNNPSPDPLALSNEGVSENQFGHLMCLTMGSGMLDLRSGLEEKMWVVRGCSTIDTVRPTGIAQVLASIVTADINHRADKEKSTQVNCDL